MARPLPIATGGLPESWRVRLPDFEGPLDLLLHLVKINKVEITDIPVAVVCDQFHEYLALMEVMNLDIAAEYIYTAAYLIHIKSKMLLPRPRDLDGRERDEDPREDLVARLLEYRRLKEAAQALAEVDSVRRGMWPRKTDELRRIAKDSDEESVDLGELSLFDLLRTFKKILDRYEEEHPEPMQLRGESFSVRDQMVRLLNRLGTGRPIDLFDDLRSLSGRREAISAFLAILEMAKLGWLRLHGSGAAEASSILVYRTEREVLAADLEAIQG